MFALSLRQEALIYHSWGWTVFPVRRKVPLRNSRWKSLQTYRPTDEQTDDMFQSSLKFRADGIACIPGRASSGLVIRDFDSKEDYAQWEQSFPEVAKKLPTVRTQRGFHVYARCGSPIYAKYPDGELIGDSRHYVVLPPSLHPTGSTYAWVDGPPLGPSEFPTVEPFSVGLGVRKTDRFKDAPATIPIPLSNIDIDHEIREAIYRTCPSGPGQRHSRIFQFARTLRDLLPESPPAGTLRNAIENWWLHAAPYCKTADFRVTWQDFREAWSRVLVPISQSVAMKALRSNAAVYSISGQKEETPKTSYVPKLYSCTEEEGSLLSACNTLSQTTGDGEFYLSARCAARVIGVSKSNAHRIIRRLVERGLLVVVKRGRSSPTFRRGTTVYRMGERHAEDLHQEESVSGAAMEGKQGSGIRAPESCRQEQAQDQEG